MNRLKKLMWLMLTTLLVLQCTYTNAQSVCENFNTTGQTGNWQAINCTVFTTTATPNANGTSYLRAKDNVGGSFLYNANYNANLVNCGNICFDYKVFDDGNATSSSNIFNTITIYTGNVANPSIAATFRLNVPVTENSGWLNICVPLNLVANGAALPGNTQGQWIMTTGNSSNWNTLVTSFAGVSFSVDVVGSPTQTELIGIDNFCYTSGLCCNPTPTSLFTINTLCVNGIFVVNVKARDTFPLTSHGWYLYETSVCGSTSDANTVDANPATPAIDPVAEAGGISASFNITDINKCYYIKHGIWQPNCFGWRESRQPITLPTASNIFNFEDAGGNVKTQFCYSEEVYLDGTASSGENQYHIEASRRNIGSTGQFTPYAVLGWTSGEIGIVNLSQLFANLPNPVYFEPNYEYSIKVTLANLPNCIPLTPLEQKFTVVCCDGYIINASFDLGSKSIGNNQYEIFATNYNGYYNSSVIHQWYVFSSPNPNGGPYTLLNQQTGVNFNYSPINSGTNYIVFHRIKTSCGDFCFGQIICVDCPLAATPCELCGPIDCAQLDMLLPVCRTPINLSGNCADGILSWNAVPGALGYLVEIQFNDPACCNTKLPATTFSQNVNTNALDISRIVAPTYSCFSWKVKTKCALSESAWSAKQCVLCELFARNTTASRVVNENSIPEPIIAPNPSKGSMNVYLNAPGDLTLSIDVYGATGKLVHNIKQKTIPGGKYASTIILPGTEKGLYTVVFKTNYGVITRKVIVQ